MTCTKAPVDGKPGNRKLLPYKPGSVKVENIFILTCTA
jgi:hypothetical protein